MQNCNAKDISPDRGLYDRSVQFIMQAMIAARLVLCKAKVRGSGVAAGSGEHGAKREIGALALVAIAGIGRLGCRDEQ
jgi:hypothetical protein